ncbi:DNA invertase Pin-like site-specific DNA recombinase [Hamadaea flava]|uniref:Recombinase family protein n=1 Tax=Hamadaea flava TaxID=1742688 RepID=A0ABV8LW02_9ACTN|nr:recombinase family protein [Hamadaea flava]MCP2327592.1 DNA invertase Pin-like site-specific DNA recombinase [Hamadaea flava]
MSGKSASSRAAIYGRNSSAKQKSINDQQAENRAFAEANGWTVVAELDDPSSASRYATKSRTNWARLLELLPSIDVVVLWEPSRGDRTLATWVAFLDACREHQVRVAAVSHSRVYDPRNPRDYRSLAEDGVDSAYESDKTSGRVRRGHATAASAGRPHAPTTYGYVRRYDPATRAFLEQLPHPEHAAVVRDIIVSVGRGEPLHQVTHRLNASRTATPRGGAAWYHSTIRGIAGNQAYRPHPDDPARGVRMHNGDLHIGQWPPLVTESEWQAAQAVLGGNSETARRARRNSAPGQIKYLLSGNSAVMTAACGSMLSGFCATDGRGATYGCKMDRCASAPMPEVDEYVTRLVVARLARQDARRLWVVDDVASRAAEEELSQLRAELEAARQSFYRPGGISAEALAGKEAAMVPAIEDARRRAQPAGAPLALLELIEAGKFGTERVQAAWEAFPLPARREVIAGLFGALTLGPATVRLTRWTPPAERLAVVADRISHEWSHA